MDNRYKACYLTDLAKLAGCSDTRTFLSWLTPEDLKNIIDLGWNPFARLLKPPVVRYLRTKFIDQQLEHLTQKS